MLAAYVEVYLKLSDFEHYIKNPFFRLSADVLLSKETICLSSAPGRTS